MKITETLFPKNLQKMVPHREEDFFFRCIYHNMHRSYDKCLIHCHTLYFITASPLFMHYTVLRTLSFVIIVVVVTFFSLDFGNDSH